MDYHAYTKKCDGMCDNCDCPPIELLSCPFCGAEGETIDLHGWQSEDGNFGPQCLECGATAESVKKWNQRAT